jgi:hypothetical protein
MQVESVESAVVDISEPDPMSGKRGRRRFGVAVRMDWYTSRK